MIGTRRCEQATVRWTAIYKEHGVPGLRDTRFEKSGYNGIKTLTKEQIINQQADKIKILEEQIELVKKLDITEMRLVNNFVNLSARENYKLIQETVQNDEYHGTVSFCCNILGVHRSGYYNDLKNIPCEKKQEETDLQARDYILMAMNFRSYQKRSSRRSTSD